MQVQYLHIRNALMVVVVSIYVYNIDPFIDFPIVMLLKYEVAQMGASIGPGNSSSLSIKKEKETTGKEHLALNKELGQQNSRKRRKERNNISK